MGITKRCTQLHPAPSTSTQLILTSTQLHPLPPSSFQSPPSSPQHPQQYLNQNIARNWGISPNLERKIEICPFWLKIGTYGKLEVMIPNADLYLWHSDLKIYFLAKLDPKSQSCPFCLKIGAHSISGMLVPNRNADFWNFNHNIHFWANLDPKSQKCLLCLSVCIHGISRVLIFISTFVFLILN